MAKKPANSASGSTVSSGVGSDFEAAKPEEVLPLLQSAIPRSSRLQCWSPGRKYSYTSRITRVNDNIGRYAITVSKENPGGDEFEAALIKEGHEEVMFSLHLPTDVVFFKAELRRDEPGFFAGRVILPVYKVQRRGAMRLPVQGRISVATSASEPSDQKVIAGMTNLSEGGVGILVSEKTDFDRIMSVKSLVRLGFSVYGITVDCSAIVRHGVEVGSALVKKSYRIGFEFQGLDERVKTEIAQLVFEESAKFLGRI